MKGAVCCVFAQAVLGRKPADSLRKVIAAQELPSNGEGWVKSGACEALISS